MQTVLIVQVASTMEMQKENEESSGDKLKNQPNYWMILENKTAINEESRIYWEDRSRFTMARATTVKLTKPLKLPTLK